MAYIDYEENKNPKPLSLLFVFLTIPFLWALCERKQDCYRTTSDCERDWNASDCKQNPDRDISCPYIGRSYSGFHGGSSYKSGSSIGTVSRGGFGSMGRAFSGGS